MHSNFYLKTSFKCIFIYNQINVCFDFDTYLWNGFKDEFYNFLQKRHFIYEIIIKRNKPNASPDKYGLIKPGLVKWNEWNEQNLNWMTI